MRIIAVGRARGTEESALFQRYADRVRPKLELVEVPDGGGAPAEARRREGGSLLAALPANAFAVALDLAPPAPDSVALSGLLERWLGLGRPLCFLIGGAEGLDAPVLARADHVLSLGPLTWPHLLVRIMVAEQLFRARSIATGHPYHRAHRPG